MSTQPPLTKDALRAEVLAMPRVIEDWKRSKIEEWPVRSNRAGELGHPCLRYLVYNRVAWRDRPLISVALQFLFDERKRQEEHAIEDLKAAGYVFIEQQRGFTWDRYQIGGKIDGQLGLPRGASRPVLLPAEIKNINQWDWEKIQPEAGVDQFVNSEKMWLRKIPMQITSYLLMNEKELGVLVARNASDGRMKVVPVELDYQLGEEMLQKAEATNAHVLAGTLPERISFSQEVCGRCPFFHICLPDEAMRQGASFLEDPELEAKLVKRAELQPSAREYERIDKEVKAIAKIAIGDVAVGETGHAIIGVDWLLRVRTIDRKGYEVKSSSYQIVDVERLQKEDARD